MSTQAVAFAPKTVATKPEQVGKGWWKQTKSNGDPYVNLKIEKDIPAGSFIHVYSNDLKVQKFEHDFNIICYVEKA